MFYLQYFKVNVHVFETVVIGRYAGTGNCNKIYNRVIKKIAIIYYIILCMVIYYKTFSVAGYCIII